MSKHIPGPWRIEADPEKQGLHPLHDNRWIVAGSDPDGPNWADNNYTRICMMMDIESQAETAELISRAPETAEQLAEIRQQSKKWLATLQSIANESSEDNYLDTGECLELLGAMSDWLAGVAQSSPCEGADDSADFDTIRVASSLIINILGDADGQYDNTECEGADND